ncbi:ABC transporter substrate-binding protein [Escherichia coli]
MWTFTLRDNAGRWITPVTAQDFVYSWQRLVDPKTLSPFPWFRAGGNRQRTGRLLMVKLRLTSWRTAVDAHTLKIQLDKPLPWFVNLTA